MTNDEKNPLAEICSSFGAATQDAVDRLQTDALEQVTAHNDRLVALGLLREHLPELGMIGLVLGACAGRLLRSGASATLIKRTLMLANHDGIPAREVGDPFLIDGIDAHLIEDDLRDHIGWISTRQMLRYLFVTLRELQHLCAINADVVAIAWAQIETFVAALHDSDVPLPS